MHRTLFAAAAVCTVALVPSTATASTTFGDNLQTDPGASVFNCDANPCTDFLSNLSASHSAASGFTSPINGIVVEFTIRVGDFTTPVTFRLVRPAGSPGQYTGAGTGPTATPPIKATTSYATRLPTEVGDRVGIDCCNGGLDSFFYTVPVAEGSHSYWNSLTPPQILVDGGPARDPTGTNHGAALALQATVEPDADHDGFGDETQDQCPTDASTQGPCPTGQRAAALKKCKKKHSARARRKCRKKAKLLPVQWR